MITKVWVTKYTCDGCGATTFVERDDPEPPMGVRLEGQYDHGGGGGPVKIFLCEPDCVPLSKAIVNVDEQERGNA